MKKIITLALILTVVLACTYQVQAHDDELEFFHPVTITKDKPLTIIDCVSLAYQNSPKIRRQKYNLDIAKSNVGLAKSGYFPVINAGVGFYNENNSNSVYYDRHYRDLPAVGVSINKMIWDFGKTTANIKMEEFYKIGAEYEFMDSLCSTLFDIKWKYYNLLKAKALLDISSEYDKITNDVYHNMAKESDKETSLVYATRAKYLHYGAINNFQNAKTDMDNAMYLDSATDYSIQNTDTFRFIVTDKLSEVQADKWQIKPQEFQFKRSESVKIAYQNSPDLHVLIATKKAMIQSLKYVKRMYLPQLDASVGYGFNNTLRTSNNSLQVGVNLNSSLNLMELKHSIKGADAQVNLAQNEIDLFKKDLYYEIQRAYNNLDKAEGQIPVARTKVLQTIKAFNTVKEQYRAGIVDYTAIHDAIEDYTQANTEYVESLYNYNTALIQLEMAMHCHLIDIHHKSGHAIHHHSEELISDLIKALECKNKDSKSQSKVKSLLFGEESDLDEDEDL